MTYTPAAVERAMKVEEVILRALSGQRSWIQVAEVLGVSARTVRRLRLRYQRQGYDGLVDRRHRVPSARRVPLAELQGILRLYREHDTGFNAIDNARTHRMVESLNTLKRFFSPQLAEAIVSGGADNPLKTHRREITVIFLDL